MKKEEIELCKHVIKILDRANFSLPAPEMVQMSMKLMDFAKMIQTREAELNKVPTVVNQPIELTRTIKKTRIKKEKIAEVAQ
jgi:hypothetical protein